MYIIVVIFNNMVLHTQNMLIEKILDVLITKGKKITM